MIRFAALAAVAAVAIAQPAAAADVRVALAGKSDAQIQSEVTDAARSVCRSATLGDTFRFYAYSACVRDTVKLTLSRN